MAVRFDASGESYSSLQVGGAATAYSVACWARLEVNRLSLSTIWQIENGVGGAYLRVTAWNGNALAFQTATGSWNGSMSTTLTVGGWYYIGFSATVNPGQARFAIRAAGSSTFTSSTSSQANTAVTLGTLWLGSGSTASEWFNGSIAAVKVWNAALTVAELQDESWTYRPQRTNGLFGWHPLLTPSSADSSGNHRPLGGGTGTAVADGPPLAWGRGRLNVVRVTPPSVTPITLSESGSAADALSVTNTPALADAGSAAQSLAASAAAVLADSASAAQALTASATVALADAASAAQTFNTGVPKLVDDAGSAADSFAANAATPLTQAASAADSLTVSVTLNLAQSGAAADALTGAQLLAKTLTDAAEAADSLSAIISRDITGAGAPYMRWAADAPEVRWAAGQPYSPWAADSPTSAWSASPPSVRYSAGPPVLEEV